MQVGTHGIIIEFSARSKRYSGTFLPDVSREQGWTCQDTVTALIRKAGYQGEINDALLSTLAVTRYQSSKASVLYADHHTNRR